jgi:SagB-type dehydrogenase family enzyme
MKEYPAAQLRTLPKPGEVSLATGDAIARRRSCRQFAEQPLPLAELSTLLQSAYGLGEPYSNGGQVMFDRPVPSGGGCYPLELYALVRHVDGIPAGIYHYSARRHTLEALGPSPKPAELETLFLNQPWVAKAHVIIVITAVASRLLHRYGDRGYRYLLIEAGHVGQNLALVANASGLGSLSLGGFFDDELSYMLGLDSAVELPVYCVALGAPDTADSAQARGLTTIGQGSAA